MRMMKFMATLPVIPVSILIMLMWAKKFKTDDNGVDDVHVDGNVDNNDNDDVSNENVVDDDEVDHDADSDVTVTADDVNMDNNVQADEDDDVNVDNEDDDDIIDGVDDVDISVTIQDGVASNYDDHLGFDCDDDYKMSLSKIRFSNLNLPTSFSNTVSSEGCNGKSTNHFLD